MDDEARGGCEASLMVVVDWRRRLWLDCCG